MKKFLIVVIVVLLAIGALAACAPAQAPATDDGSAPEGIGDYAKTISDEVFPGHAIPPWMIVAGAIVIFLIGVGIIWRLIPGFVKFIALIVLAAAIAGAAYGIWHIPAYDKAKEIYDEVEDVVEAVQGEETQTE